MSDTPPTVCPLLPAASSQTTWSSVRARGTTGSEAGHAGTDQPDALSKACCVALEIPRPSGLKVKRRPDTGHLTVPPCTGGPGSVTVTLTRAHCLDQRSVEGAGGRGTPEHY